MKTNRRKLFAKIITEDYGFLSLEVTGIQQVIQAVQVDVWEAGQEAEHHLVVFVHYPEINRNLFEELENRLFEHFGDIINSFTVSDEPGKAIIFIPSKQQNRSSLLSRAAAIAVVKYSWGWDESEKIQIICEATSESIEVKRPLFEKGQFEIEG